MDEYLERKNYIKEINTQLKWKQWKTVNFNCPSLSLLFWFWINCQRIGEKKEFHWNAYGIPIILKCLLRKTKKLNKTHAHARQRNEIFIHLSWSIEICTRFLDFEFIDWNRVILNTSQFNGHRESQWALNRKHAKSICCLVLTFCIFLFSQIRTTRFQYSMESHTTERSFYFNDSFKCRWCPSFYYQNVTTDHNLGMG